MLSVWMYLCGPLNGISINYISEAIGHTYKTTYYMIRAMMDQIQSLQEKVLSGDCETDEMYKKAASKGVRLETNGEDRTLPSRRALPRGPGRGTFEKNTPMITLYHQRATKDDHDWTIFDVPRAGKSLMEMVQNRIKKGSKVMTDCTPVTRNWARSDTTTRRSTTARASTPPVPTTKYTRTTASAARAC